MLDKWSNAVVRPVLHLVASGAAKLGIQANHITLAGFAVGILALPALTFGYYNWALGFILVNRFMDGLDGAIARVNGPSDLGGYLDIVLDFVFYSSVIVGFGLADPANNAVMAVLLLFGFMGTGSSFLAFATIAAKQGIENPVYKNKSLYYLGGLTEGTETIGFFILMCLLPAWFPVIAGVFAVLCGITTFTRIMAGVWTFREA